MVVGVDDIKVRAVVLRGVDDDVMLALPHQHVGCWVG